MFNNVLRYPLFAVPKLAIAMMEVQVSVARLEGFLAEREVERLESAAGEGATGESDWLLFEFKEEGGVEGDTAMNNNEDSPLAMAFRSGAAFVYPGTDVPVVRNLNVVFPTKYGAITVIVGPTGSGKTSLLLALLGSIPTPPAGFSGHASSRCSRSTVKSGFVRSVARVQCRSPVDIVAAVDGAAVLRKEDLWELDVEDRAEVVRERFKEILLARVVLAAKIASTGVLRGTPFPDFLNSWSQLPDFIFNMAKKLVGLNNAVANIYEFQLDHWGLNPAAGEALDAYFHRIFKSRWIESKSS
ncbi:hypothetical protein HDU96_010487, partial [Phlyctochytrium bullatum]